MISTEWNITFTIFQFQQLQLGYMTSSPEVILQNFLNYLRRNETRKLQPGEGAGILKLTHEVILFIANTKMSFFAVDNMTNTVLLIIDEILLFPNSLTQANVSTKTLIIRLHSCSYS